MITISQYQKIDLVPTGLTYELEVAKILNIDTTQSINDVIAQINKELELKEYKVGKTISFNDKEWMVQQDLLDATFEQWVRLETLTAEENNVQNLHKLLAIYLRPTTTKFFKKIIEPFDMNTQEKIEEELLNLPMDIANALVVFFWLAVPESMKYMKIHYLNQINKELSTLIKQK